MHMCLCSEVPNDQHKWRLLHVFDHTALSEASYCCCPGSIMAYTGGTASHDGSRVTVLQQLLKHGHRTASVFRT